ncbi:MAG: potassium/proton antiporter [Candidatus Bipolaricaulis sp.]|nr:potassium/proton antiporter [Candidatus Bipolaricaulis sp.]MDD5645681.1 potassium/proton antiporter [Candidatus Bipolaricaulis sp.]
MPGIPIQYPLLAMALLLLLGVLTSKTSERLGIPALVFFLFVGMLAGSEGIGGIEFDDPYLAYSLGMFALTYILFAGGLDTAWSSARSVLPTALLLATFGVALTATLVGVFAVFVLDFPWLDGLLLGAVMSSTDAAAVFAVLRSRRARLKGRLRPLLEFESGSNDPMAVFLTVTIIGLIADRTTSWTSAVPTFFTQMLSGGAVGLLAGYSILAIIRRIRLETYGLYPVLTMSLALLGFAVATAVGGSGILAVYVAGIVCATRPMPRRNLIMGFHDGLAWLMQITMFVALGLLVFPSRLVPIVGPGLALSAFLMFFARPVSVALCTLGSGLCAKEKLLVGWCGLRGAVPIVLATFPLLAGTPLADRTFNLVFFVVLTSSLLQGSSIGLLARWLGLVEPEAAGTPDPVP